MRRACTQRPGPRPTGRLGWTAGPVRPGCDDDAVPTLNDLAASRTNLGDADVEWLHALVSDWQLLADLSLADLLLWAPVRAAGGWRALAQMRPTTGPPSLQDDRVGALARTADPPPPTL